MSSASNGPVALVLGATGLVGRHLVEELDRDAGGLQIRLAARRVEQIESFRQQGRDAVFLDLDDPSTFPAALAGVDRLFLLTGYSVAMLAQSKAIVDAARKARVSHILHLGTFGNWDCTDPHFAWHQLIETYIEASGIAWTHFHPNVFMELLSSFMLIRKDRFPMFWGDNRVGWIAAQDIAQAVAAVLREGPQRHDKQNYWLSAEVAGRQELVTVFSEIFGRAIHCDVKGPDEFLSTVNALGDYQIEPWYAAGTLEFLRQVADGRMGYIGTTRNDGPFLTGKPATTLRQWAQQHKEMLYSNL